MASDPAYPRPRRFALLREDFDVHGRTLTSRTFWAMALYRFGRAAARARPGPVRWAGGKLYGALNVVAPIFTGVSIDRRVSVGRRFHLIHPGLIMLHPAAVFGDHCGVMHNVTLGTSPGSVGVPRVGHHVFIGAGATLLGGITIGDRAVIAANSLVIADVPPGMLAMGVPAKNYPIRPPVSSNSS